MTASTRPAVLQAVVETETPEGGRVRAWSDVAALWVTLTYGGASADAAQEMRPTEVETAVAAARAHPAAVAGQQLAVDSDEPWRVLAVRCGDPAAGRMTLLLSRQV